MPTLLNFLKSFSIVFLFADGGAETEQDETLPIIGIEHDENAAPSVFFADFGLVLTGKDDLSNSLILELNSTVANEFPILVSAGHGLFEGEDETGQPRG